MIKIYLITNLINNKKYVGQTIKSIELRWKRHCWSCTLKANRLAISGAIKKYNKENFKIEQIDYANSLEEANKKEVYWANFYNCFCPNGYNLKAGGRKYIYVSEETKIKIGNSNRGKKISEETRKRLSDSHKGIKLTEEAKQKLSILNKGKKPHKNTQLGASQKVCKKYLLISPENIIVEVVNMKKFCKEKNIHPASMSAVVQGHKESCKGWRLHADLGFMFNFLGSRRNPLK